MGARSKSVIVSPGITLRRSAQFAAIFSLLTLTFSLTSGCLGKGGAVNVRWRISERETGRLDDPRDDSDSAGVCCQKFIDGTSTCAPDSTSGWHINRVQLVLTETFTDAGDGGTLANPPGLDSKCGARELTTPFDIPGGVYAITLRAYNPNDDMDPTCNQAQSPLPEIRTVKAGEIVQLDVVELSVSNAQGDLCGG